MQSTDYEPEVEDREPTPDEMEDRIPLETFIESEEDVEEEYGEEDEQVTR